MCGIVGYLGDREATPIILKGLKRLEYRGYDSAGLCIHQHGELRAFKKQGKVSELEDFIGDSNVKSNSAIGHTRWATHGEPSDVNAHPHFSNNNEIAVIHNGIIENYESLRKELLAKGFTFQSDTDTEVFTSFIQYVKEEANLSIEEAVRTALSRVIGAYAIVVMSKDNPEKLIAARKGSPLVIGLGKNEFFIASDATPIVEYTNEVVYLNDEEIAIIDGKDFRITNISEASIAPLVHTIDIELDA
ncbi:MAG: class II glutamine amidotransferase, partial [Bacteroidota bacterium]